MSTDQSMCFRHEKVLELIVKKQLDKFIEDNKILIEYQSGFRKGHSCETAIQADQWKVTISSGKMISVIFMDLKRAFETIDRKKLITKMERYGIKGKVLSWFKSYVNGRYQQVKLGDEISEKVLTEYGVPQGSMLGPLLFTLYINDIIKVKTEDSTVKLFADDTMIFVSGESAGELETKLQAALNKLENWLNENKLKMNASKTKYMVIRSSRKDLSREIRVRTKRGEELERITTMKYLGVLLDNRLTFKDHCDYILKKVGKKPASWTK